MWVCVGKAKVTADMQVFLIDCFSHTLNWARPGEGDQAKPRNIVCPQKLSVTGMTEERKNGLLTGKAGVNDPGERGGTKVAHLSS